MKIRILTFLTLIVPWGLESYTECTHPQTENFFKWCTWIICSQNTVDSRVSCGVGTRVSAVRGGHPLWARPCPGSLCTHRGGPRCSWGAEGLRIPLSRSAESSSDIMALVGDSGWWEPGRTEAGTRRSCSEAPVLMTTLCRPWITLSFKPYSALPGWYSDKSSDILQDQQLTLSGDRTCAQMSQLKTYSRVLHA